MNKRGSYRGRRGFGGSNNHRGNREGVRGGGVNRHFPTEERTNLEAAQKVWECIYGELNSQKTVDCRKLISARNLAKEHFRRQDSGYPASASYMARCIFDWFADSGATSHMTDQQSLMMDYKPIEPGTWMVTGIGCTSLAVHGQVNVAVITQQGHLEHEQVISPVLHVPDLGTNLFSIGSATEAGMKAVFTGNIVRISTSNGSVFAEGERAGRTMYHLKIKSRANDDQAAKAKPA